MESVISIWMHEALVDLQQDYVYFKEYTLPAETNLWDVYRQTFFREHILPKFCRTVKKYKKDIHAWVCTCKDAYINGYPKIKRDVLSVG